MVSNTVPQVTLSRKSFDHVFFAEKGKRSTDADFVRFVNEIRKALAEIGYENVNVAPDNEGEADLAFGSTNNKALGEALIATVYEVLNRQI